MQRVLEPIAGIVKVSCSNAQYRERTCGETVRPEDGTVGLSSCTGVKFTLRLPPHATRLQYLAPVWRISDFHRDGRLSALQPYENIFKWCVASSNLHIIFM
ncbi:MAG: hypothetical protein F4239_01795 [Gammaproteobacteria bacterium]|nr:hypothetical protein [Gammaproteobacteria bacterium]